MKGATKLSTHFVEVPRTSIDAKTKKTITKMHKKTVGYTATYRADKVDNATTGCTVKNDYGPDGEHVSFAAWRAKVPHYCP